MNITIPLKKALITRSVLKRRRAHPFLADAAERYRLPSDAGDSLNNSYYFSCHDNSGTSLLFRHAQRGGKHTEVWFAYRDADGSAYISDKQFFFADEAPTAVECAEPKKAWRFSYDGEVKNLRTGALCRARFAGTFEAAGDIFEFGHDVDVRVLAEAIAREKWSKKFFAELQGNDQVHYEQPGHVTGELVLGGAVIPCNFAAMRDHSYGKRDWSYMNRHFWLMALMADGRQLNANMVSYPALKLTSGYYLADGKTVCVESARIIEDVQKPHAVPDAFTLAVRLVDGHTLSIACRREEMFVFPFDNGAYTIYEGVGVFEIDGATGRGILEFGWNGDLSRCV